MHDADELPSATSSIASSSSEEIHPQRLHAKMNSISYLDSVLTRSLTSSRAPSGATTPSKVDSSSSSHQRLNRRASDYSLSRDRERRRIALSLGLSALDAEHEPGKKRKSSRRSSRKGSETEASSSEKVERSGKSASNHPKSSSESKATEGRARLNRTGSTPAYGRTSLSSARWSGLWGLGGWLDGTQSHDSYSRRSLTSSSQDDRHGAIISDGTRGNKRRASTSDADAALVGISPESLLSERERENVVDFEGYDPEEDLQGSPGAHAPPSTPFPPTGETTPIKEKSRREGSGISTGSRLSSILFGALNPLTDDYFGPQPSPPSTPPQQRRKKSDDDTSSSERKRQKRLEDSPMKAFSGNSNLILDMPGKEGVERKETSTSLPLEPPPPYSDVASSVSAGTLLLPSPDLNVLHSSGRVRASSRRKRAATLVVRGIRGVLDFLRRLFLAILLAPVRIARYSRHRGERLKPVSVEVVVGSVGAVQRKANLKGEQSTSTVQKPAANAARQKGNRRQRHTPSSKQSSQDDSSDEEVVTEEQAEMRARRKAASSAAAERDEEAAVDDRTKESKAPTTPTGSRLLPNPHPIDPLLAHDRNAKPVSKENLSLVQAHVPKPPINAALVASRGPLSSLIHHSPKVLVLDLDETLIHSTSRSPTWGALTDKSKGRAAVTAGGSLLGLEGLGGMMGLRGQVGVRPHQVEVVLDGRSIIYHVYKRPHVDHFLRKVAAWYHVVIFTASVQEYADPVIDWLDQGRGLVGTRLFRESCTFRNGSYLKNLAHVDADLSRVCLVDNSPASYLINQGECQKKCGASICTQC